MAIAQFIPVKLLSWMFEKAPIEQLRPLRLLKKVSNKVSNRLVEIKKETIRKGVEEQDLLSLCIKANLLENPRGQMSDEELAGQLR
jgi:hypothetical protein